MSANVGSIKDRMRTMKADIDIANEEVRALQTQIEGETQRADDVRIPVPNLFSLICLVYVHDVYCFFFTVTLLLFFLFFFC